MSKYNSRKTTVDGITFDSKKEARRYLVLKKMEQDGEIKNLRLQVPVELVPSFEIVVDGKTTVKALAESGLMLGKTESALRGFFNRSIKDGSLEGFKYAKGTIEKI
jgi:hypothetical protein